ncbi:glucosamine-6-phosphate deaminase [Caldalkalibacillus salinus]|uniref:glucosamine-6-phosphate deaminase n=1 Tax=Caldalkalibacillus salinus TaxID=2803787 RepID=UPI001921513B|nr:glucosamine-6-phosphate deaminase [Caldalkalibacillus salinus]
MKVIVTSDYEQLSQQAARAVYNHISKHHSLNLGLATGSTPLGLYKELIQLHHANRLPLADLKTFNLDEYVGLSPQSPYSYRYYMNTHVFEPLGIPLEQTYIPRGDVGHLQQECDRYDRLIQQHGGIDVQILGVGVNGHIGFNEPGTSFNQHTHVVQLAPSTIEANAKHFPSKDEVPTQAITMGIASIMQAKHIYLLASGEKKAKAIQELLSSDVVTEQWPVTVLREHPQVTVMIDESIAQSVQDKVGVMNDR